MTDYVYLVPSFLAVIFLPSIAFYLLTKKPRKAYITVLSLFCLDVFLWNMSIFLINIVGVDSPYALPLAKMGAAGLIFIAPLLFHFIVSYTGYLETKIWYPLVYGPAFLLLLSLLNGYYVEGVAVRGFGIEPVYGPLLQANDMIALILVIFSTFLIFRYYRESAGIKKYQSLYVLIAVPLSSMLSFLSYEALSVALNTAQFPVGSSIDLGMAFVLVYAILKFKLPVETAAEVDFRILAETASEGICVIDTSGRIDYANSHFSDMAGTTDKKIIGEEFGKFVAPDYRDILRKAVKKMMKGNKITNLELVLKCRDGTLDAQEELNKQKTYFQALFESTPEAIASLDRDHNVIDANPAFIKLFGYTLDEIKGKNLDDFILPDGKEKEGRGITKEVMRGKTVAMETVRKRKDGSLVPVSLLGAPIFVDGVQVGIFGIYRDITEQKEAEEEKEFYNSLLRHDVANRNMVVQGNLEILDSVNLDPEQRSLVSNALSAARASTDLIKKIRELREAEGNVVTSPVVIDEVILRAIKTNSQQAKDFGVKIDYEKSRAVVKAGPLTENIFSNLIQNAIIHGGCKHISIRCDKYKKDGKTFCKMSIEDDGKGGLGLYLVKKLVENYGGWIEIEEGAGGGGDGRGTTFNVYLEMA